MLSEQQQRIMGYFIEEAKDHLNTIEQGLLNLQATIADPEMANEVFRAAHSVKGGAAMLGLTSIQNTSHRLEDYFKVLKECPIQIDQKLETLLLRVYDTLQELLEQLQGPFGLTDDKAEESMAAVEPTFAELNQHLSQLVSQSGAQTPEDVDLAGVHSTPAVVAEPAARATTEESALRFIFQNDVPARLREMLQIFKQEDTPETRAQLRALCDVLAQPGEQLDLPDWCELLNTAEHAIANSENTYRALAPIVIKEIKRAQEQVLAGNSAQITASSDLLALVPLESTSDEQEITDAAWSDLLAPEGVEQESATELDLFSTGVSSNVTGVTNDLMANDADFELTFDTFASGEVESSHSLDLSFIDQFDNAIPTLSNNQTGPEVGAAELNSLADLFEGEEPDLGFVWQEELVEESAAGEPESLELNDLSNDFSDLLFQDSEALVLDESEEDLSGLLNNSAQAAEPSDAFTFGTDPTPEIDLGEINLTDFDQELTFPQSEPFDESFFSDSSEMELGLDSATFLSQATPDGSDASDLSSLDELFSDAVAQPDSALGSPPFDALFDDNAEQNNAEQNEADSNAAEIFDFNLESASDPGSETDLGLWQLETVLDPWQEGSESSQLATSSESDPTESLGSLLNLDEEADPALASDLSWLDSESAELTSTEPVAQSEPLDLVLELDAATPGVELNQGEFDGSELNVQPLDEPTIEALNRPDLELTADEAADLDFNFDQSAFDSAFDTNALTTNALTADVDLADLEFDELAASVEPEAAGLSEDEVTFYFGAPADDLADDLTGDLSDASTENDGFSSNSLDLNLSEESEFAESAAEPTLVFPDLDLDSNSSADADWQFDLSATDLDASETASLLESDMDTLLQAELLNQQATDSDSPDLAALDELNLDEFALPDDFSEMDSSPDLTEALFTAEIVDASLEPAISDIPESDIPDLTISETPEFEAGFSDSAVLSSTENPFASGSLEALFETEPEFEAAIAPDAVDNFDFALEPDSLSPLPPQADAVVDETEIDLSLFEMDAAIEHSMEPVPTVDTSFDLLFTSESTNSESADANLSDWDAALSVSNLPAAEPDLDLDSELGLEDGSFELDLDDFNTANPTTEQLLDTAFSVDGIEDENLLEFAPDNRVEPELEEGLPEDNLLEDNLTTIQLDAEAEQFEDATTERLMEGLDDTPAEELSLDFDLPDLETVPSTEGLDFGIDDFGTDDFGADLNTASAVGEGDLDLSLTDPAFSDSMELNFEPDLEDANSLAAAEASLPNLSLPDLETEPLDLELLDETPATDLTTAGLDLDLDLNDVDDNSFNFADDNDFGEQDVVDLSDWEAASPTASLIAEGDLNDLELDSLLEEAAFSADLSLSSEPMELDAESVQPPDQVDDIEAMLMEGGSVELGAVSAEPADFNDLAAMLADEPLPTTAIHVEEDEDREEEVSETAAHSAADDDFADLEALLDDGSEVETLPEIAPTPSFAQPVTSPPLEVEDEFSDLEALLQDADQALGVGSSQTRKASATANRRPNRRGGLNEQTMRVTVKHLDNLNNLVGEMVVNRNSLEQAEERLRQFLDNLLYQVQQLSDVGQRMRDLYERSLLESSLLSGRRGSGSPISAFGAGGQTNHAAGMSFDALEMDRFTGFHVLSQEMIELIVRVRESASDIDFVVEETDQVTRNFRQITTQLQEGLTRSRMVPFSQTADRLPRGVRDNSLKYGKQAELIIEGRDTMIDKMIVEQLYDPMTHLVNNAIAHGIETPEERIAAGKSPTGQITIRAFHQGNQTVISVSDDGAGINPEKVRAKALAKGLINAAQAREMTRLDTYDLLFHHGFSTADQIDDLRGRGVGLDVVRNNLNEIRGAISIDSTIGKGTTFTIRLPLTLSISKALCCISNRARIAFPMDGVEDMLDVPKERIQTDEQNQPCIQWRDIVLPFQPLSELLRYNRILGRGSVYGGNQEEDVISIVVLRSAGNFLALQVDQVLGEQEIVIKQLEGPVPKPLGVAGATVLGDGRIMPIADVLELIDLWQGRIRRESGGLLWDKGDVQLPPEPPAKTESTVLIVDDSITVRELLSMTFSKVGYRVEQARDGQEAWEKLRAGLPCDLVFCDIEMPRMDGLELLSRIQKDSNLSHLPIAMLTSRGADRHRQMAVQLGAKGYFTKPYLEEVLLDAAQRMLKGEIMIPGANTQ